jgi:hypothetical protein
MTAFSFSLALLSLPIQIKIVLQGVSEWFDDYLSREPVSCEDVEKEPEMHKAMLLVLSRTYGYALKVRDVTATILTLGAAVTVAPVRCTDRRPSRPDGRRSLRGTCRCCGALARGRNVHGRADPEAGTRAGTSRTVGAHSGK